MARTGTPYLAVVILTVALGACSSGGEQAAPTAKPSAVEIKLFSFKPSPIEVRAGDAVSWTQRDNTMHTVTSGTPGAADGRFQSENLAEGATFSFTFTSAGTFPYFCSIHNSMTGEVRVT